MNYLEMAKRLHRERGNSSAGPTSISGASVEHLRLFDWLADKWRDLQAKPIDWRWMRRALPTSAATTLSTLAYTGAALGASDFGRWRKPIASDGDDLEYTVKAYLASDPTNVWRLHWMPLELFKLNYYDSEPAAGQPMDWSISDSDELLIGPKSDQAYRIKADYLRDLVPLEVDSDTPDMPTRHHMLLVWQALEDAGTYDAAPETIARAKKNAERMEMALEHDQVRTITIGEPLA